MIVLSVFLLLFLCLSYWSTNVVSFKISVMRVNYAATLRVLFVCLILAQSLLKNKKNIEELQIV